jgi:tetratricopeptide (TPR) repeat protein
VSQSPTDPRADALAKERAGYEKGWVAIHRMLREGLSWSGHERNTCFLNLGAGRAFADVSYASGLDFDGDGRALASVDWDQDGDLDLWLASRTSPRVRFLRNQLASPNSSVAFTLRGSGANTGAIGARVELELEAPSGSRRRIAGLRAGDGYLSQSSKWVHFGLIPGTRIEAAVVRWPGGEPERFEGIESGGRYRLVQGSGRAEALPARGAVRLSPGVSQAEPESARARIVLAARPPVMGLSWLAADGSPHALAPRSGALLVNLWASWCAPCIVELEQLAAAEDDLAPLDLDLLALSVDDVPARPAASDRLARIGWPYGSGFASRGLVDQLDLLQKTLLERRRRIPLPTSFLIDSAGNLAVIYKGPVDPDQLRADVALCEAQPDRRLGLSVPFAGRWHAPSVRVNFSGLEAAFRSAGFESIANAYQRLQFQRLESSPAKVHYEMGVVRRRQGQAARAIGSFRTALDLEPEYLAARVALAFMLQQTGELDLAIEAYRAAQRLDPTSELVAFNLALALTQADRTDEAARQVEVLRRLDPDLTERLEQELSRRER